MVKGRPVSYQVKNRFLKYLAYSSILAVVGYLLSYIISEPDKNLREYYLFINIMFSISIMIIIGLFVLFLVKQFTSDNIVLKSFMQTEGYINLLYTIAWSYSINIVAIIFSLLSISIYSFDYIFNVLLLMFIWLNLFSITRCFNVMLMILKHARQNNS